VIATVVSVAEEFTQKGAPYKKVTVVDGTGKQTTKNIFSQLEDKWDLLEDGKTLDFKMEKKGQFWNVVDITKPNLPPPQSDKAVLPEHQKEIDRAQEPPKKERNPQEVGLAYKILSELYVHGFIDEDKPDGKELVMRLKMWLKDVLLVH